MRPCGGIEMDPASASERNLQEGTTASGVLVAGVLAGVGTVRAIAASALTDGNARSVAAIDHRGHLACLAVRCRSITKNIIRIAIWIVIGAWITGGFDDDC